MEVSRMKKLTVSLDDEVITKLEELAKKDNRSLSEIVRFAVLSYYELSQKGAKITDFEKYIDLIASREHVTVDVGLWTILIDEINNKASEEFWSLVEKIGNEYGFQLREMGVKDLGSILKFLEITNWFKVKFISENSFNLILTTRNEMKLVRKFLEGIFNSMGIKVEMAEGLRKIMVKQLI